MPKNNLYAKRNRFQSDRFTDLFENHMMAMTFEGLHSKSDIAAELAHRDLIIEKLKTPKFLVFAGQRFYANGGANDVAVADCMSLEEAIKYAKTLMNRQFSTEHWIDEYKEYAVTMKVEWVQVFDLNRLKVVHREGEVYGDESGLVLIEEEIT